MVFTGEKRGPKLPASHGLVEKTRVIANSLEQGLDSFYLTMAKKIEDMSARQLFHKLSQIEVKHTEYIMEQ